MFLLFVQYLVSGIWYYIHTKRIFHHQDHSMKPAGSPPASERHDLRQWITSRSETQHSYSSQNERSNSRLKRLPGSEKNRLCHIRYPAFLWFQIKMYNRGGQTYWISVPQMVIFRNNKQKWIGGSRCIGKTSTQRILFINMPFVRKGTR
jgi:hypothetical protein